MMMPRSITSYLLAVEVDIIRAYIVSPLPTSCGINYVLTNWGEEEIHVKQESSSRWMTTIDV